MKDYKTWDEWRDDGVSVLKGQKSHLKNDSGKALFHKNQTDFSSQNRRWIPGGLIDPSQVAQDLIDDGICTLTAFDIGADF